MDGQQLMAVSLFILSTMFTHDIKFLPLTASSCCGRGP